MLTQDPEPLTQPVWVAVETVFLPGEAVRVWGPHCEHYCTGGRAGAETGAGKGAGRPVQVPASTWGACPAGRLTPTRGGAHQTWHLVFWDAGPRCPRHLFSSFPWTERLVPPRFVC